METGLLLKSIDFAAEKHKRQKRKDQEESPYINHPIGVAMNLWIAGVKDINVLQAAVLHDTLEDTNTTIEELEKEFGKHVATIVQECSDDKSLAKDVRKKKGTDQTFCSYFYRS